MAILVILAIVAVLVVLIRASDVSKGIPAPLPKPIRPPSGHPVDIANDVMDQYEIEDPDDPREEWEEVFTRILATRSLLLARRGYPVLTQEQIRRLVWNTWSGSGGCLALLAFEAFWWEADDQQRAYYSSTIRLNELCGVMLKTVLLRRPDTVHLSNVYRFIHKAMKVRDDILVAPAQ